ncbi:MAG: putative bifunctional diguanylate cyclase/phosphodiesterase [Janthinobacterium lividum]
MDAQAAVLVSADPDDRVPGDDAMRDRSVRHLLSILDGVPGGIVTVDRRMSILFVNHRIASALEIPPCLVRQAGTLLDLLEASEILGTDQARQLHDSCVDAVCGAGAHSGVVEVAGAGGSRILTIGIVALSDASWLVSFNEITERREAEARAIETAMCDPLTGLLTRRLFQARVSAILARMPDDAIVTGSSRRHGQGQAVLLIDLDRFKAVNDTLGHHVGDALLGLVSRRLRSMTRHEDILARLGGDEFALVISPLPTRIALAEMAARVVDLLGRPYLVDGHLVNIGASVGVAVSPDDGTRYDKLLRSADLALYDAKNSGRGAFSFFDATMDTRASDRRLLEIDLRKALALHEFELHYQPQVDLDTNAIVGFEALLRWRHPVRGLVSPGDFIPLAEELGLIVPIGEWVMLEACREAARWPNDVAVAVNVSPHQFEDIIRLTDMVARSLRVAGLPGCRLEIEITESALLRNEQAVLTALQKFRTMGVRVAMDDFGTGYSSLSQLQSFPFDKIKIDRSFVRDDSGDVVSQNAIIRAINALGASLGMSIIAEGVETVEQLARIRTEGCTSVQGYLFSRPVAPAQIDRLLAEYPGQRITETS